MSKFNKSAERRRLKTLSEAKVIKECKKYNIKIYKLTKPELIDKLLMKLESKHKAKQTAKTIKKQQIKSTPIQHYVMLINGISRENQIARNIFPQDIASTIIQYIELFRIFDTLPTEYQYAIQNYGTFINRKQHLTQTRAHEIKLKSCTPFIFGVSKGFQRGSRDNVFKVQIYQNNLYDSFGIISRLECCYKPNATMNRIGRPAGRKLKGGLQNYPQCFRYYMQHNAIWENSTGKARRQVRTAWSDELEEFRKKKAGDILMMKVDMDKWFIRFYVNGKLYGKKVKIIEQDIYYPVVGTQKNGKYRVVF